MARGARAATLSVLLLGLAAGCPRGGGPHILSGYASRHGANDRERLRVHAGVDYGAPRGSPVLAAADGEVEGVDLDRAGCGLAVLLSHGAHGRYTVYCHLAEALVARGDVVRRGDVLGRVGTSGSAGDVPHVHLELCTSPCPFGRGAGALSGTEDPLASSAGCFDPRRKYPNDRLRLTHPLRCQD